MGDQEVNNPIRQDITFLLDRSLRAGSCTFTGRDTGTSSDSIVAVAYGLVALSKQQLPSDQYDLDACNRMWAKLPEHRKTPDAIAALARATKHITRKYPKTRRG